MGWPCSSIAGESIDCGHGRLFGDACDPPPGPLMAGDLRIGCSGWVYKDWRGSFYPDKLPQREWLAHYSRQFDTVEINNTFYRLPSEAAVKGWVEQTPDELLLRGQGEPLSDPRQEAQGPGAVRQDAPVQCSGADERGAASWPSCCGSFPPNFHRNDERLRESLSRAARGPPRVRVPASELVLRRRLRAAAPPQRRAGDGRRPRDAVPGPRRAHRRLDLHALPPRQPRARRQLLARPSFGPWAQPDPRVAARGRRLRLLQQRPARQRLSERASAEGAAEA